MQKEMWPVDQASPSPSPTRSRLERLHREEIVATLNSVRGNRSAAARILGIGRNTLLRKLKAKPAEDPVIYFITDGMAIKIGYTINLAARLSGIQSGNPRELAVVATIPAATRQMEQALHDRFERVRLRGEWYKPWPVLEYLQGLET